MSPVVLQRPINLLFHVMFQMILIFMPVVVAYQWWYQLVAADVMAWTQGINVGIFLALAYAYHKGNSQWEIQQWKGLKVRWLQGKEHYVKNMKWIDVNLGIWTVSMLSEASEKYNNERDWRSDDCKGKNIVKNVKWNWREPGTWTVSMLSETQNKNESTWRSDYFKITYGIKEKHFYLHCLVKFLYFIHTFDRTSIVITSYMQCLHNLVDVQFYDLKEKLVTPTLDISLVHS